MQPSEEIKSKLNIEEVIQEYIQLKRAGTNFTSKCPFHSENSPSFMVSPEKQIWHCFGCGKGGDMFSFVMEMEGVDFKEALRILAPKANVTLKKQDPKTTSLRNKALDIHELSRKFYYKTLLESDKTQWARDYLKNRGLDSDNIEEWQIGASTDNWDDLIVFLKTKGYNDVDIFQSGMSVKSQKSNKYFDRFRDRVIFPINDINGNTIAFSARINPTKEATEKMGKYINSPQGIVYDKSKVLYGLDKAKMSIRELKYVIIVEGQMDVITAHKHGFKNVVASSGTALTTEQVNSLKRYTKNIALAFDMDEAGSMAADRGIDELLAQELNIKVIEVAGSKDPDECIRSDVNEWIKSIKSSKPVMQYFFDKYYTDIDLNNVFVRTNATKKFLSKVVKISDLIERSFWTKKLSEKINMSEDDIKSEIDKLSGKIPKKINNNNTQEVYKKQEVVDKLSRIDKLSEQAIAIILKDIRLIEYSMNNLEVYYLSSDINQAIYKNLIIYYNSNTSQESEFDLDGFKNWLKNEYNKPEDSSKLETQSNYINRLVILSESRYQEQNIDILKKELIFIILELKKNYIKERMEEVKKSLIQAENNDDNNLVNDLMHELKILTEEFKDIK